MNRREVFKLIALQILANSCSSLVTDSKREEFFLSSSKNEQGNYSISLLNLSTEGFQSYQVSERSHSIVDTPNYLLFIPKAGAILVTFDKRSQKIEEVMVPLGFLFYGHGVSYGDNVYFSLADKKSATDQKFKSTGFIAEYIPKRNHEFLVYPSGGRDPHEIGISKQGDHLYICNGGGKTNLVKMDRKSKEILEVNILSDEFKHLSLRHLCVTKDQVFLATKCNFLNAIPSYLFVYKNNQIKRVISDRTIENKMRLQILSIISHGNYIYMTCPATSTVFIYNEAEEKMVQIFDHIKATSLAYSREFDGVIVGSASSRLPLHVIKQSKLGFQLINLKLGNAITGEHSLTISHP